MLELEPRKPLSTKGRVELFREHKGMCCICGGQIKAGESWDVEHNRPLAMGGTNDSNNLAPAHRKCHASKTKQDVANIAKAKRNEAKHFGAKVKKPWPKRGEYRSNVKQLDQL